MCVARCQDAGQGTMVSFLFHAWPDCSCLGVFPAVSNPENEIQKANLPQSTGRKLFGKILPDRFWVWFRFFQRVSAPVSCRILTLSISLFGSNRGPDRMRPARRFGTGVPCQDRQRQGYDMRAKAAFTRVCDSRSGTNCLQTCIDRPHSTESQWGRQWIGPRK